MTTVITPTPGRIVWFYPAPHDGLATLNGQPLAAIVAGVHNENLVNLAVFDAYGNTQQRSNVTLLQPEEDLPAGGAFATWMPYQVIQAEKAERAQAEITPLPVIDQALFAESDGTSASETGLVNNQITDSVTQSPEVDEAAPSSSEPTQA